MSWCSDFVEIIDELAGLRQKLTLCAIHRNTVTLLRKNGT